MPPGMRGSEGTLKGQKEGDWEETGWCLLPAPALEQQPAAGGAALAAVQLGPGRPGR